MTGGVVDLANAGFDEDREPETECQTCIRVFWCQTCHDTGEIEVMTQGLGPDDYTETIACPDCNKCKCCATSVGGLIERLERELAAAKGDADRYRWLRSHPVFQVKELPNELELLDACIDRHMAGRETEE